MPWDTLIKTLIAGRKKITSVEGFLLGKVRRKAERKVAPLYISLHAVFEELVQAKFECCQVQLSLQTR